MKISPEKLSRLTSWTLPFLGLGTALLAINQEGAALRTAKSIQSSELGSVASSSTHTAQSYWELSGNCSSLGTTSQKIFTTYVSSGGLPTIEGKRKVFLYSLADQSGHLALLASETQIPNGVISVRGKVHPTSKYFVSTSGLPANSDYFMQVKVCNSGDAQIDCEKSISTVP